MERELWRYLSRSQLGYKFSRQMPIGPFYVDFLCRQKGLIIEVDGWSHDVAPERDVIRDEYFEQEGYRILHFTNHDVRTNVAGVVAAVQQALAQ